MTKQLLNTKFVTPEIVCSFPSLFEPSDYGDKPKYQLSIPIPYAEEAALKEINQCIINAAVNKWGEKAKAQVGKSIEVVVRDFSEKYEEDDPVYANTKFFTAKSDKRPGIVDNKLKPIMDEDEIYAGCIVRAAVTFYAYEFKGKKGVAAGLNNVMKVRDGEPLGGRSNAEDDFASYKATGTDDFVPSDEPGNVF